MQDFVRGITRERERERKFLRIREFQLLQFPARIVPSIRDNILRCGPNKGGEAVRIKMRNQFLQALSRGRDVFARSRMKSRCARAHERELSARGSPRFPPRGSLLTCNGKKVRPRCIVKLAHRKQSSHSSEEHGDGGEGGGGGGQGENKNKRRNGTSR